MTVKEARHHYNSAISKAQREAEASLKRVRAFFDKYGAVRTLTNVERALQLDELQSEIVIRETDELEQLRKLIRAFYDAPNDCGYRHTEALRAPVQQQYMQLYEIARAVRRQWKQRSPAELRKLLAARLIEVADCGTAILEGLKAIRADMAAHMVSKAFTDLCQRSSKLKQAAQMFKQAKAVRAEVRAAAPPKTSAEDSDEIGDACTSRDDLVDVDEEDDAGSLDDFIVQDVPVAKRKRGDDDDDGDVDADADADADDDPDDAEEVDDADDAAEAIVQAVENGLIVQREDAHVVGADYRLRRRGAAVLAAIDEHKQLVADEEAEVRAYVAEQKRRAGLAPTVDDDDLAEDEESGEHVWVPGAEDEDGSSSSDSSSSDSDPASEK